MRINIPYNGFFLIDEDEMKQAKRRLLAPFQQIKILEEKIINIKGMLKIGTKK